jgi:hypothetical protein
MYSALGGFARLSSIASLAVIAGACADSQGTPPPLPSVQTPWFANDASAAGLDFVNDPGPLGSYSTPQITGNGAALLDYDQDGRLDIYLMNGAGVDAKTTNRLYHQEEDGRFRDVTTGSGLDVAGLYTGVAVGDVDNDGWPDVVLTECRGVKLFRNSGAGRFEDVTSSSGLANPWWGTSCGFLDFDRDGWLDLVVVNYVDLDPTRVCYSSDGQRDFCGPLEYPGSPTLLFRNVSAGSEPLQLKFEDITESSGIGSLRGRGMGLLCADFDQDGWDDIFVANDMHSNHLWMNRQGQTVEEEGMLRGVSVNGLGEAAANMGTAWGDVDGSGLPDLFVTHLDYEDHTFWKQGPAGVFLDRTPETKVNKNPSSTGFGTVLGDFDLDGDLDLAYVNGRVFRREKAKTAGLPAFWLPYAQNNTLCENDGTGQFVLRNSPRETFAGNINVGRILCSGDVDNDGDLDLLSAPTAQAVQLWRNIAPRQGHWLLVRAMDPQLKRDAYGAVVTVVAGDRQWQRLMNPASGYQCSHDPRAHFGLGDAARIESVHVRWPGGETEIFPGGGVDRQLDVRRGEGRVP